MLKNNPYVKSYLNIINESVNIEKYKQIAKKIGGVYDVQTNTIDCKGNKVRFKNDWLDQNGTFDFKLINTSNEYNFMFMGCISLTHLPDNFTIPQGVTDCTNMFCDCQSLTHLPDNFTIPQGVTNCRSMFMCCTSLKYLPDSFTIPQSVTDCHNMFDDCESLTHLPDGFTFPQNITSCHSMFMSCKSLTHLPDNFTIPNSVTDCSWMFKWCRSLTDLPDGFTIPIDCYCEDIFYGCDKIDFQDPKAYQQWEI